MTPTTRNTHSNNYKISQAEVARILGCSGGYEMSQSEVARILGCSRANIFNIEQRALRKLRRGLEARGYKASDFLDVSE